MGWGTMGLGMMGHGAWFGFLVLLLLVIAVVLVASNASPRTLPDDPEDVFKQRLARGEITRQEYEELKQAIHA